MKKLTSKDIFNLYKEFHVPRRVISHMLKVAEIAEELCDKLIKKGCKIDKDLVIKAALLHDIARITADHGKVGCKILSIKGHKRIANLIKKHVIYEIDKLKTWEEKILFYADKRVEGSRKVLLKTRLRKIRKRSLKKGRPREQLLRIEKKVIELEKEIKKALTH